MDDVVAATERGVTTIIGMIVIIIICVQRGYCCILRILFNKVKDHMKLKVE